MSSSIVLKESIKPKQVSQLKSKSSEWKFEASEIIENEFIKETIFAGTVKKRTWTISWLKAKRLENKC